jgi:hypothetical protein
MEQLADKGNGNSFYIDSLAAARKVFQDELGANLEVVARDVKLQVDFDPAQVARYRLVGYENRTVADDDFRNDKVDAGEIGPGHQVTAMYELELTDQARRAPAPLATVRIRHKAPEGDATTELAFAMPAAPAASFRAASPDLQFAFAVSAFADLLRGQDDARAWSLDAIDEVARATAGSDPDRLELVSLIDKARRLLAQRGQQLAPPAPDLAEERAADPAVAHRMIVGDRGPAAMLEHDLGARVARAERHLDVRGLTAGERDRAPREREPHRRLPRRHPADLVQRALAVLLEDPPAQRALEVQRTGRAARDPIHRPAPPPPVDLLGEHRERIRRRDRHEHADPHAIVRRHRRHRVRLRARPRVRSACALNAANASAGATATNTLTLTLSCAVIAVIACASAPGPACAPRAP